MASASVSLDREALGILLEHQRKLEDALGYKPSLSQVVKNLARRGGKVSPRA